MANIITVEEFGNYRDVGKKPDADKLNECIKLAQEVELYDLLGDFAFDVVVNKDEAGYADLMNGSSFTYKGQNYTHQGVKALLADLAYARYLYNMNINLTPFGMVSKFSDDSRAVDRNTIKDVVGQAQKDSSVKLNLIDRYLEANKDTFSRYFKGENPTINKFTQRWDVI